MSFSCDNDASNNNEEITGFTFTFDETGSTIIDSSGNNYNASATGLSRVPGKIGKCIQFLGEGSAISLEILYYFPFSDGFTFMAWLKFNEEVTDRQQIIGGWGSGFSYPIDNFGISIVSDKISFEVPVDPNMISVTSSDLNIIAGEWFHIAISYNGDEVKFYKNGESIGTSSLLTTFKDYSFRHQIGYNYITYGGTTIDNQFYGYIDELIMKNEIYSVSEILNYYNSTK